MTFDPFRPRHVRADERDELEELTIPDPVFDPKTPWHLRVDEKGKVRDEWAGKKLTPSQLKKLEKGELMPPEVETKGEESRKELEKKLDPLLSPSQKEKLEELKQKKKQPVEKPADRYIPTRAIPPR